MALSGDDEYRCALRLNGTLACWADPEMFPAETAPTGSFQAVSVFGGHGCGLGSDGTLACWAAASDEPVPVVPSGRFRDVSLGGTGGILTGCAVGLAGTITCWGLNGFKSGDPPDARYTALSVGGMHACAIESDGTLACWWTVDPGDEDRWTQPPQGTYAAVTSGQAHSCALRAADGAAVCWGDDSLGQASPPSGRFMSLSAGSGHSCGVREDSSIVCWGDDGAGQVALEPGATRTADASTADGPPVRAVSAGEHEICAIRPDRTLACWGEIDEASVPPTGRFSSVSVGSSFRCAVRTDGRLACWGWEIPPTPRGTYVDVSVADFACAVRTDGRLVCWGDEAMPSPKGRYSDVSVGPDHACALGTDRHVRCWSGEDGTALRLAGEYSAIATGSGNVCGLRTDGRVECVSDPPAYGSVRPEATYATIAARQDTTCGVRTDGGVDCWGSIVWRAPQASEFTSVSLGDGFACGVTAAGALDCWGGGQLGQEMQTATVFIEPVIPRSASRSVPVRWSVNSPFRSVDAYDVRFRLDGESAKWTTWATGQSARRTTIDLIPGRPGDHYLIQVRARSDTGWLGDWVEVGTSLPFDEAALERGPGWRQLAGASYYGGSALRATRRGSMLRLEDFGGTAVLLVATMCPTCGTVLVSVVHPDPDEEMVSPPPPVTVSLRSPKSTQRRIIPVLTDDESLYGTLEIKVVSRGRPVIIDGVWISFDFGG